VVLRLRAISLLVVDCFCRQKASAASAVMALHIATAGAALFLPTLELVMFMSTAGNLESPTNFVSVLVVQVNGYNILKSQSSSNQAQCILTAHKPAALGRTKSSSCAQTCRQRVLNNHPEPSWTLCYRLAVCDAMHMSLSIVLTGMLKTMGSMPELSICVQSAAKPWRACQRSKWLTS